MKHFTLSVLVCLAVAVCSSQAFRLPIKPPPFLENQVDQWKEDAAAIRDRLEQELQKLRDEIKGLLGGCKNEETTAAPEPTTTTQSSNNGSDSSESKESNESKDSNESKSKNSNESKSKNSNESKSKNSKESKEKN